MIVPQERADYLKEDFEIPFLCFNRFLCLCVLKNMFSENVSSLLYPMEVYKKLGFPGAVGSMDCTRRRWTMCPSESRQITCRNYNCSALSWWWAYLLLFVNTARTRWNTYLMLVNMRALVLAAWVWFCSHILWNVGLFARTCVYLCVCAMYVCASHHARLYGRCMYVRMRVYM